MIRVNAAGFLAARMADHLGEHQGHSLALTEGMYAKGDKRAHSPPTLRLGTAQTFE